MLCLHEILEHVSDNLNEVIMAGVCVCEKKPTLQHDNIIIIIIINK